MTTSAIQSLVGAILLGAMLAASAPVAADEVTDSSITSWVNVTVAPSPLSDADIAYAVRHRILSNATIVSQGIVVTSVDFDEIRVKPATVTISKRSDARLAKEIRDSFRRHWTTSRVADRIRVSVKDGIATLTGDLDTWGERFEAGRVAFGTGGVWKVQNRLTVKGYDYEWEKWEYEAPYYYEELFPNVV